MFAAGDFGGFTKECGGRRFPTACQSVANGGVGRDAGGGVGLAALGGNPQLVDFAFGALQLGGKVHEFLGLARSGADGLKVAVLFDGKAFHGLAGFGNTVDDALGPLGFNADNR